MIGEKMKFSIGEEVVSEPSGAMPGAVWVAEIVSASENEAGGCYGTVGRWEPIKDENGNVSEFWERQGTDNDPTFRQLWGTHLRNATEKGEG